MTLELLFLGTGTSSGVPMIGCGCEVCRSHDPRDQRTRASVLIRYPDHSAANPAENEAGVSLAPEPDGDVNRPIQRQFLIDTSPEMRVQLIRHEIDRIDGVWFTHTHADHVFGIDDLRRFNAVSKLPVSIYLEESALESLRSMFGYIFEPRNHLTDNAFVPNLIPQRVQAGVSRGFFGARWTPLRLLHGRRPILGFRVDYPHDALDDAMASIAYCTDVSRIPPETYPLLEGLDVLVIDALRYRHHPTHMTVDQALEVIDQVQPKRAYLTHIAHDIQHADLEAKLPEHVFLAFDGLTVEAPTTTK